MSRQYLSAGSIVEEVIKGKSLKAYCASVNNLGKVDYALAMETLKYRSTIDSLLEECSISASVLDVREGVLMVMVYELLFGAGAIHGGGSVKRKILEHLPALQTALKAKMVGKEDHTELLPQSIVEHARIGAFVRVNTAKITLGEGLAHVKDICPDAELDEHIPSLIALPPKVGSLGQDEWVKSGKLVIQDKASCFPSQVLYDAWTSIHDGSPGDFIDACAAPGNKTSHLATLALAGTHKGNPCSVFAFEKNPRRAQLLQQRMTLMGVDGCVVVSNSDFLATNVTHPKYANVTAILLDPSCSGSGVVKSLERALEAAEEDGESSPERLTALQAFQIKVIQKAMTFPRVQRIVYSTCSVHKEENEMVVAEILRTHGVAESDSRKPQKARKRPAAGEDNTTADVTLSGWRLASPSRLQTWPRRGLPLTAADTDGPTLTAAQSAALIRCAPEDGTNGFFVSLFERVGHLPPPLPYDPALDVVAHSGKNLPKHVTGDNNAKPKQPKSKDSQGQGSKGGSDGAAGTGDYAHGGSSGTYYRPPKEKVVKATPFLGKFKVQTRKKR